MKKHKLDFWDWLFIITIIVFIFAFATQSYGQEKDYFYQVVVTDAKDFSPIQTISLKGEIYITDAGLLKVEYYGGRTDTYILERSDPNNAFDEAMRSKFMSHYGLYDILMFIDRSAYRKAKNMIFIAGNPSRIWIVPMPEGGHTYTRLIVCEFKLY